jgi:hypothetical protein
MAFQAVCDRSPPPLAERHARFLALRPQRNDRVTPAPSQRLGPLPPRLDVQPFRPIPMPLHDAPTALKRLVVPLRGGGEDRHCTVCPMSSTPCPRRVRHGVRLPRRAGPVALLLCSTAGGASSTACPRASSVAPMPARGWSARPKRRRRAPRPAAPMPPGTSFAVHPTSGAQARCAPRGCPRRASLPTRREACGGPNRTPLRPGERGPPSLSRASRPARRVAGLPSFSRPPRASRQSKRPTETTWGKRVSAAGTADTRIKCG